MTERPPVVGPQDSSARSSADAAEVGGVLTCVCGSSTEFSGEDDVTDCSCGRTYVLTITELSALPNDR